MAQGKGGGKFSEEQRAEAFWAKVLRRGPNECWRWLGATYDNGYGSFWNGNRCVGAHVFSFCLIKGITNVPRHIYICHSCDNVWCVNPRHLFPGTGSHNQLDCVRKGRKNITPAMRLSNAKLNDELVLKILKDKRKQTVIARELGLARETIGAIKNRRSWKHVKFP